LHSDDRNHQLVRRLAGRGVRFIQLSTATGITTTKASGAVLLLAVADFFKDGVRNEDRTGEPFYQMEMADARKQNER
jgi:hypothetical protein